MILSLSFTVFHSCNFNFPSTAVRMATSCLWEIYQQSGASEDVEDGEAEAQGPLGSLWISLDLF